MSLLWGTPRPGNCGPPPSDKRSSAFFQVPRPMYRESPYFHIFHIFLQISFIIPSYSFIFLHISFIFLRIFFIFLHIPGTWKNFELFPRLWDLEKFLHIELSSYIWALGLEQNPNYEYLIYGHKTCFCCRDLDGNLFLNRALAPY